MEKECIGCKKGVVFVAKVIVSDDADEIAKLSLCDKCRKILLTTVQRDWKKLKGLKRN